MLLPLCIAAVTLLLKVIGKRYLLRPVIVVCALSLCVFLASVIASTQPVTGTVQQKTERVQVVQTGLLPTVLHIYRVVVVTTNAKAADGSARRELTLAVDAASFDRLSAGQTLMLREIRLGPLAFARLADAPIWRFLAWPEAQRFWPWYNAGNQPGPTRQYLAIVLSVRTVHEALLHSWTRRNATWVLPLPQPYDEVTFHLQVPGGPAVTALDRVDFGSLPNLSIGRTLPVIVSDARWREARLAHGTRRYAAQAWRGLLGVLMPQIIAGFALALLIGFGLWRLIRRLPRRAVPRHPEIAP